MEWRLRVPLKFGVALCGGMLCGEGCVWFLLLLLTCMRSRWKIFFIFYFF